MSGDSGVGSGISPPVPFRRPEVAASEGESTTGAAGTGQGQRPSSSSAGASTSLALDPEKERRLLGAWNKMPASGSANPSASGWGASWGASNGEAGAASGSSAPAPASRPFGTVPPYGNAHMDRVRDTSPQIYNEERPWGGPSTESPRERRPPPSSQPPRRNDSYGGPSATGANTVPVSSVAARMNQGNTFDEGPRGANKGTRIEVVEFKDEPTGQRRPANAGRSASPPNRRDSGISRDKRDDSRGPARRPSGRYDDEPMSSARERPTGDTSRDRRNNSPDRERRRSPQPNGGSSSARRNSSRDRDRDAGEGNRHGRYDDPRRDRDRPLDWNRDPSRDNFDREHHRHRDHDREKERERDKERERERGRERDRSPNAGQRVNPVAAEPVGPMTAGVPVIPFTITTKNLDSMTPTLGSGAPWTPTLGGTISMPIQALIQKRESEKQELVKRKLELVTEMGAVTKKITDLDEEITQLYFKQGQVGANAPVSVPAARLDTPHSNRSAFNTPLSPTVPAPKGESSSSAAAAAPSKRKNKKEPDAIDLTEDVSPAPSNTAPKPKKQKKRADSPVRDHPGPYGDQDDPSAAPLVKPEPGIFEIATESNQLALTREPMRHITTDLFNRVPRALVKAPKSEMMVASSLDGAISFLEPKLGSKLPSVASSHTLDRTNDLGGLPWAEDLDFFGSDLLAIAAAPKYMIRGEEYLAPYKLGILNVPEYIPKSKSGDEFATTLYIPDKDPHDKAILCVTSPQIEFDTENVEGLRFVTGGADRKVFLWTLTGLEPGEDGPGKAQCKTTPLLSLGGAISDVAWNGRSKRLFVGSQSELVMYDIDTHKTLNSSKLPAIVSAITLHERNDSLIMVTMKTKGKNMGIYDTRKNKVVLEFGHPEPGQQATNGHYRSALSPSGELAVSGTTYVAKSDSKVENYVWDLRWTGMKRNKPAVTIESQHKSAMQRFLWWSDRSYFSTSTGYGCEYVTMK